MCVCVLLHKIDKQVVIVVLVFVVVDVKSLCGLANALSLLLCVFNFKQQKRHPPSLWSIHSFLHSLHKLAFISFIHSFIHIMY